MNEEIEYWINEFPDLDPEDIKELLEAVDLDVNWEVLNKRKHFNIDD